MMSNGGGNKWWSGAHTGVQMAREWRARISKKGRKRNSDSHSTHKACTKLALSLRIKNA